RALSTARRATALLINAVSQQKRRHFRLRFFYGGKFSNTGNLPKPPDQWRKEPRRQRKTAERRREWSRKETEQVPVGLDHRRDEVFLQHATQHDAQDRRGDGKAVFLENVSCDSRRQHHADVEGRVVDREC